jgi:hypothetical protein
MNIEDLKPETTFTVNDGVAITPSQTEVEVRWVDVDHAYHKTGDPAHLLRQTTLTRFLDIITPMKKP